MLRQHCRAGGSIVGHTSANGIAWNDLPGAGGGQAEQDER